MLSRSNGVTKEEYYDENHHFVCSCGDLSDHLVITVWRWEKTFEKYVDKDDLNTAIEDCIEVSLSPSTAHYLGFFRRLWASFKYVFLKRKCNYDVMEFRTLDLQKIRTILVDFRTHIAALAWTMNKSSELPPPEEVVANKVVLKCKSGNEVVFAIDEFDFELFGIDILQMLVCLPNVNFFKRLKFGWRYLKVHQDEIVNLTYEDAWKLHSLLTKMR